MLTKDQIFAAKDTRTVTVKVPEWGGEIKFKTMTGTERAQWLKTEYILRGKDSRIDRFDLYAGNLILKTAIKDDGSLLFDQQGDLEKLNARDGLVLDRLFEATARLNGILSTESEKRLRECPEEVDWLRLSWQFGIPVDELQARMDSPTFGTYRAFLELHPDVGTRLDWLLTDLAHLLNRLTVATTRNPDSSLKIEGKLRDWGER